MVSGHSSDADVHKAIHKAKKHGHGHAACEEIYLHNAYKEAAVASWHPDPDALVEFAMTSVDMESSKLLAILQQGTLTNSAVKSLAMALPPTKSEERLNQVVTSGSQVWSKKQRRFISEFRGIFRRDQKFFVRKANEALRNYSQQKGVRTVICFLVFINFERAPIYLQLIKPFFPLIQLTALFCVDMCRLITNFIFFVV